jgi:hypothetical protein
MAVVAAMAVEVVAVVVSINMPIFIKFNHEIFMDAGGNSSGGGYGAGGSGGGGGGDGGGLGASTGTASSSAK